MWLALKTASCCVVAFGGSEKKNGWLKQVLEVTSLCFDAGS